MNGEGLIDHRHMGEIDFDKTREMIEGHMARIERLNEILKNDGIDSETKSMINETIRVILNGIKNPVYFVKEEDGA